MTTPDQPGPKWLYPIPAYRQVAAIIGTPESDLPKAHRISAEYAMLRSGEAPRPSRGSEHRWHYLTTLNAKILTPPENPAEQFQVQHGMTVHLLYPADNHTLDVPMPLLVQHQAGADPIVRCDPGLIYPNTPEQLTELITAATDGHPHAPHLAAAVMEHHRYPRREFTGLTDEQANRVAEILERGASDILPGETSSSSVFQITYEDGCYYIGHTASSIAERILGIHGEGPAHHSTNHSAQVHGQTMAHSTLCLNSGLAKHDAQDLRRALTGNESMNFARNCPIRAQDNEDRINLMHAFHQSLER